MWSQTVCVCNHVYCCCCWFLGRLYSLNPTFSKLLSQNQKPKTKTKNKNKKGVFWQPPFHVTAHSKPRPFSLGAASGALRAQSCGARSVTVNRQLFVKGLVNNGDDFGVGGVVGCHRRPLRVLPLIPPVLYSETSA